jgi:hypothetical protein
MVRKLLILCFLFLLLTPLALAADLTIKTHNQYRASVSVLKTGGGYSLIDSFHKDPDSNGDVKTSFSSVFSEVDIAVWLKTDKNEVIFYKRFGPYSISEPILIDLYPEQTEEETSEEENNTIIVEDSGQDEEGTNDSVITAPTGAAIKDVIGNSRIIYFIIGIIAIAGVVLFLVIKKPFKKQGEGEGWKRDEGDEEIYGKKKEPEKSSDDEEKPAEDKELRNAEEKLEALKKEISEIKNKKSKLQEAEERFQKAKDELDRLKRE